MSKYSRKIESWMNNNNELFSTFDYLSTISTRSLVNDPKNNNSMQKIHKSFMDAIQKKHIITLIEQSSIKPIHGKKYYPLMYIFYFNLQLANLLNNIVKFVPDLTNYHTFTNWYHNNVDSIDHNQIHKIMESLDDKDTKYQQLIDVYRIIYKTTDNRKLLHDVLYDSKFIGIDIQNEMESHEIIFKKYLINNTHSVNLFIPRPKNTPNNISINHQHPNMNLIAIIIDAMDLLSKEYNTNIPKVDLTICYTNKKKSIISNNNTLGPNNINSGASLPGHYIICWRQEELYKVLIHELIHFHNFDFYDNDPKYDQLNQMINVPKINGSDKLNESYTETLAIIMMCVLIVVLKQNEKKFHYDLFVKLLKKEVIFLMFQFAKVLNKFGIISMVDYFDSKIILEQKTSFRSYFIIKLILLLNLHEMIQFLDGGLIVHNARFLDFGNLINESYEKMKKNEQIINIIENFMAIIKNHKTEESWIYWTMRMSANEIE